MEQFNGKIYEMYTALKKRKKLDDELARKQKVNFQKLQDAMMAWVKDLEGKNEELRQKMSGMLDEHKKVQENFLAEIRAKDEEVLRLNLLLAEKTVINNSTAVESLNRTPEIVQENSTLAPLAKKTPQSSSRKKRPRLSEEAIAPNSSSAEEEARELECSRSHTCAAGNGTNESSSAHMFRTLLESLVCMKISFSKEIEGFSFSACHEDTGYSFTLTWLEQRNEWRYKVSSLGSLESVAKDWMNQDIKFSMDMCRLFFERISNSIKKS